MLGTEEEKLFDAPLSISKREQLERQVGVGVPGQTGPVGRVPRRAPLSHCLPSCVRPHVLPALWSQCGSYILAE